MPKVSILMPTFNRSSFLKEAIESVLLQNISEFEIIVADNASTDNTKQIVALFDDKRIVYFRNENNIGVVNNYNKALKLSKGEYIYIFSDDDVMLPNNILKKMNVLDSYSNVGLVHSNIRMINEVGEVISDNHWAGSYYDKWKEDHDSSVLFDGKEYFKILYEHWNIISMPSVMIRKSIINATGEFNSNTHYFCDWDLWMRISLFSDVYYLSDKLLDYRIHSSNVIRELSYDIKIKELTLVKENLFLNYTDKMRALGILENDLVASVEQQIAKYPVSEVESIDTRHSILRRIKNKVINIMR